MTKLSAIDSTFREGLLFRCSALLPLPLIAAFSAQGCM
jgi:hypothetical protein